MKNPSKSFRSTSFYKALLLTGILVIGFFNLANAQDDSTKETTEKSEKNSPIVEIKLLDGTSIIGELIHEDDEKLTIDNVGLGEVEILKSKIDSYQILPEDSLKDGIYWHTSVNSSRSLFTPTGYGLKKGEGYYQNFMLLINQVSYGITDNFSIGLGFEVVSLITGLNQIGDSDAEMTLPAFMLTPKFSIPIKEDKWNVGVGGLLLHIPYADFNLGVIYGVSTWGGRDHNITLGAGFSAMKVDDFDGDDNSSSSVRFSKRPAITVAGTTRLSKRFAMVSENWFFSDNNNNYGSLNTLGVRYLGDRVSIDLSLMAAGAAGEGFFISPVPLVGLTIPFGKGWGK